MSTDFWYDPWLPGRRLIDNFGSKPAYDLGLGSKLIVSRFILDGKWHNPHPSSKFISSGHLMGIFHLVHLSNPRDLEFKDEVIWTAANGMGRSAVQAQHSDLQQVQWWEMVWFKGRILSIPLRMAIQKGLKTRGSIATNPIANTSCVFCNSPWKLLSPFHRMLIQHADMEINSTKVYSWSPCTSIYCAANSRLPLLSVTAARKKTWFWLSSASLHLYRISGREILEFSKTFSSLGVGF